MHGLDPCPCWIVDCSGELTNPDESKWIGPKELTGGGTYHPGAKHELRSAKSNAFDAGNQCTYDGNGQLITEGYGAGTADRQRGVLSNAADHYNNDVYPFDLACQLDRLETRMDSFVNRYIEVRPPINDPKCARNKVPDPFPVNWACNPSALR